MRFVTKWLAVVFLLAVPALAVELQTGITVVSPKQSELERQAKVEGWTFKFSDSPQEYHTGLKYPGIKYMAAPSLEFLLAQDTLLVKKWELSQWAELAPVPNQLSCGSCVYFATISAYEDSLRLRSIVPPTLSHQQLMDCYARDWRCEGSYFEKVAGGLVEKAKGKLVAESDYPYTARNGTCKNMDGKPVFGQIESARLIDPSPKSVITAIRKGYPVAITVGAGGAWMSYRGGVFNACSSVGTNHQIELVGYDCETSVDANGNCVFDAQGKLPPGVGLWKIKNSWGTSWGDKGYMWTKMTDKNGRLCNNIVEEAGILEIGIDPKPECEPQPKADAGPEKSIILQ